MIKVIIHILGMDSQFNVRSNKFSDGAQIGGFDVYSGWNHGSLNWNSC